MLAEGFNGLARATASLPVAWYSDPAHHDRELRAIWQTGWLAFCRAEEVAGPLSHLAATLAGINALVLRDRDGRLRAFHNICRHRGAEICAAGPGRLERPALTCPYHAWTYALDGRLVSTGPARPVAGFARERHGLVPLGLAEWGGMVFINAAGGGQAEFEAAMGADLAPLAPWPLADLVPVASESIGIACNWKVFWENFNECLHCPGVHRDLSRLVPIYGRGIMVREDDPDWAATAASDDPRRSGRLRAGAESWTADGTALAPAFPGLSAEDRARGHTYAVALPSLFAVGHLDHVRTVRVLPLGPGRTRLDVTWLMDPQAGPVDLDRLTGLARTVLAEDAAACEVNQRGLAAAPFAAGTLMQEEYEVAAFQSWVRARLGEGA